MSYDNVVTPKMIEAGIQASRDCDPSDTVQERFDAIYRAMYAKRPVAEIQDVANGLFAYWESLGLIPSSPLDQPQSAQSDERD